MEFINAFFSMMHLRKTTHLLGAIVLLVFYGLSGASSATAQLALENVAMEKTDTIVVSLSTAIEQAMDSSPEVAQVGARRQFAEARWQLARASRFMTNIEVRTGHSAAPGLKGLGNTDREALYLDPNIRNDWSDLGMFNQFEIEALQPIYTWGELRGNIEAARFGYELEQGSVNEKESEIALRAGELYYGLLLARSLYQLTGRAGDIVDQAMDEIQRLLDEGANDVDDADLFQVQITEQEFLRRVVEVTERLSTARTALSRQIMLPGTSRLEVEDETLEPLPFELDSLYTYFEQAFAFRPEMQQVEAGIAARNALVDVARSDYFPKLFVGVRGGLRLAPGRFRQPTPFVGDPFRGRTLEAGLGIRLKLNRAQTRARVSQARAEAREVSYQRDALEQLILFEVEEAYRNLIIARAALEAQTNAFQISKDWLRTEMVNFDLDLGDTENLVRAVQASLQLEAQYLESIQKHNVAILRLLDACGTLPAAIRNGTLVE